MSAPSSASDDPVVLDARAFARVGEVLRGKYTLDRLIGVGGMASVFAATHRNGKEVAVKLLHAEFAHNAEVRSRFIREGYLANQVKHPGAVSVIDDDETDGGDVFLVMELLQGMTVQSLCDKYKKVHPAWVTAITLQVLEVMASAHANGIIHRDLKPDNLFVTAEGAVKVLDFGIARMRSLGLRTTNVGALMGTPSFMAPEQARGRSKEVDEKTDLWAIGSVAFELLTGDVVHPAESVQEAVILAATRQARPLGPLAPGAPEPIVRVIERALAFDKADRWASATEMREALAAAAYEAYGSVPDAAVLRDVVGSPRSASSSGTHGAKRFVTDAVPLGARPAVETLPIPPVSATLGGVHTSTRSRTPTILTNHARVSRSLRVRNGLAALGVLFIGTVALASHWAGAEPHAGTVATKIAATEGPSTVPPVSVPEPDPPAARAMSLAQAATVAEPAEEVAARPAVDPRPVVVATSKPPPRASSPVQRPLTSACEVPYTLDKEGHKHFRAECF